MRARQWSKFALVALLASIANAGLFAMTSDDFRPLAPIALSGVWLLPGVVAIGALVALAVDDAPRAALAELCAALVGATVYGLAIAVPGLRIAGPRVFLIDRGTTFGLVAFLICALFGMAGLTIVWIARVFLGRADV